MFVPYIGTRVYRLKTEVRCTTTRGLPASRFTNAQVAISKKYILSDYLISYGDT